jgi:hypothetical protein
MRTSRHLTGANYLLAALVACAVVLATSVASAQGVINSFETPADMASVAVPDPPNAIYVSHGQSAIGVTDGAQSLFLKQLGGGNPFATDSVSAADSIRIDTTMGNDPAGYSVFAAAAANPSEWLLEFDVTLPPDSWAGADFGDASTHWSFPIVGLSYDDGTPGGGGSTGFGSQQLGVNLYNVTGANKISIPLDQLTGGIPLPANSNYYQVQIGANQRFQTPPSGGVTYYIDKLRLSPVPTFTPTTLYSWETPDNPATADVNEALEGWSGAGLGAATATSLGNTFAHTDSVTDYMITNPSSATVFPTHGTHSMKIDTTSQDPEYVHPQNTTSLRQSYGFRWGTNLELDSTLDADDTTMTAEEAANAAKISDLASKINGAFALQFDVAFSDPILDADPDGLGVFQGGSTSSLPNFLSIAMHISDERGTFFQYDVPAIDQASLNTMILEQNADGTAPDEPVTMTLPLASFIDKGTTLLGALANNPIPTDSDLLRIGLALNFGTGPVIAHIDNLRVLREVTPLTADFDDDGDVDAADLTRWRNNVGPNAMADADGDGDSDGNDFLMWQQQVGGPSAVAAAAAVPEPACVVLGLWALAGFSSFGRRGSV